MTESAKWLMGRWEFTFAEPGGVLYIGQRPIVRGNMGHVRDMVQLLAWPSAVQMEVWPAYAEGVRAMSPSRVRVVVGDARNAASLFPPDEFTLAVWRSGPEHIPEEDLADALAGIERVTTGAVLLACPYGEFEQGVVDGNPHQEHVATLYPHHFEPLGYTCWQNTAKGYENELYCYKILDEERVTCRSVRS